MSDLFEDTVFSNLITNFREKRRIATGQSKVDFKTEISKGILNFEAVKRADSKARIIQTEFGYEVSLSKAHIAFSMKQFLQAKNRINLLFSDELLAFEPDEELLMKSEVPLWVIKPLGNGNRVMIQRVW